MTTRPTFDVLRAEQERQQREDGERLLHLINDPECMRALYDLAGPIRNADRPLDRLRSTIDLWREQVAQEKSGT